MLSFRYSINKSAPIERDRKKVVVRFSRFYAKKMPRFRRNEAFSFIYSVIGLMFLYAPVFPSVYADHARRDLINLFVYCPAAKFLKLRTYVIVTNHAAGQNRIYSVFIAFSASLSLRL